MCPHWANNRSVSSLGGFRVGLGQRARVFEAFKGDQLLMRKLTSPTPGHPIKKEGRGEVRREERGEKREEEKRGD